MLTADVWPVLVPSVAFVVNVAVLMGCLHVARCSFILAVVIGFGAGLVSLFVLHIYGVGIPAEAHGGLLALGNLAIYGCLSYGFFNAANIGESSIRVRLLREIAREPAGLSEDALNARYNDRQILKMRLERMLASGRIVMRDQRYVLNSAGLMAIAGFFVLLKQLLLRRSSEFE